MYNVRLDGATVWEITVHLAVAGDVFDGVCPCFVLSFFPHKMSWMRYGTELSQFLSYALSMN